MSKALLKTIRLYPTSFDCDIWICDDAEHLDKCYMKRYNIKFTDDSPIKGKAECASMETDGEGELKNKKQIVLAFDSISNSSFVHESVHALHHLSKWTGLETGFDAQEWNAWFIEYVFDSCCDEKGFEEYVV